MLCRRIPASIVLIWLSVLGLYPASGTLVFVIPTRDGIVLAADSRLTLRGKYVDGVEKIHTVRDHPDLAFALTGQFEFLPAAPDDVTEDELRAAWTNGPRQYSGRMIMENFLVSRPSAPIDEKMLGLLGKRLSDGLVEALRSRMNCRLFYGKALFRSIVAQYDRLTGITRVGSLRLELLPNGIPTVRDIRLNVLNGGNQRTAFIYGEQKYFEENVLRGVGSRFISSDARHLWAGACPVGEFSASTAATIVQSWLHATAQTSQIVPLSSGVGGKLSLFLLNGGQTLRGLNVE